MRNSQNGSWAQALRQPTLRQPTLSCAWARFPGAPEQACKYRPCFFSERVATVLVMQMQS